MQQKSDNLQYNILVLWADGKNNSLTKRLMFQTSFFFIFYYGLKALKTLYFIFYQSIKKIETIFAKNFERNFEKKIILGPLNAWLMSQLSQRNSEPAHKSFYAFTAM